MTTPEITRIQALPINRPSRTRSLQWSSKLKINQCKPTPNWTHIRMPRNQLLNKLSRQMICWWFKDVLALKRTPLRLIDWRHRRDWMNKAENAFPSWSHPVFISCRATSTLEMIRKKRAASKDQQEETWCKRKLINRGCWIAFTYSSQEVLEIKQMLIKRLVLFNSRLHRCSLQSFTITRLSICHIWSIRRRSQWEFHLTLSKSNFQITNKSTSSNK